MTHDSQCLDHLASDSCQETSKVRGSLDLPLKQGKGSSCSEAMLAVLPSRDSRFPGPEWPEWDIAMETGFGEVGTSSRLGSAPPTSMHT